MSQTERVYFPPCDEPLPKRRKLDWDTGTKNLTFKYVPDCKHAYNLHELSHTNKRKYSESATTCREEMTKKQKLSDYWNGRNQPTDKYDFLIISSMPNCIHRYIK